MDVGDWRAQFPTDSRKKILIKIMQVLTRTVPYKGEEGLRTLKRIAVNFERKIYSAGKSRSDYTQKISRKLLDLESRYSALDTGKIKPPEIQNPPRSRPVVVSCPSELISTEVLNANLARSAENSKFQDTQRRSLDQNRVSNLVGKRGKPPNVVTSSRKQPHQNPHHQDQLMKEKFQPSEIQRIGVSRVQPLQLGFQKQLNSRNPRTLDLYQQHEEMLQRERQSHMQQQRQTIVDPSVMRSATLSTLQQNQPQFSLRSQSIPWELQQQWGSQQNGHPVQSGSIVPPGGQQRVFQEKQAQSLVQSESTVMEQQQQQQRVSGSQEQHTVPQQQLMIGQKTHSMDILPSQLITQESNIRGVQWRQERPTGQQTNMPNSQQHSQEGNKSKLQQHGAPANESGAVSRKSTDVAEEPHARLLKAMLSISHKNLVAAVEDIFSAIREADGLPESVPATALNANFRNIWLK